MENQILTPTQTPPPKKNNWFGKIETREEALKVIKDSSNGIIQLCSNVFWEKLLIAALRAAEAKLDARAGKKKGGWGEWIFARPRFSAASEIRASETGAPPSSIISVFSSQEKTSMMP